MISRKDQIRTSVVHALMGPLGASAPINAYGPRTEQVDVTQLVQEYQYREDMGQGRHKTYLYTVRVDVDVSVKEVDG